MNNLMIFESRPVEVFEFEGKVLFNPKHVAECLELGDSARKQQLQRMNEKQVITLKNSDISKGTNCPIRKIANRGENFLTQSGVYKMIFVSRSTEAEKFQNWVTDEVLPQIRQTGGYVTAEVIEHKLRVEHITAKVIEGGFGENQKVMLPDTNINE